MRQGDLLRLSSQQQRTPLGTKQRLQHKHLQQTRSWQQNEHRLRGRTMTRKKQEAAEVKERQRRHQTAAAAQRLQ